MRLHGCSYVTAHDMVTMRVMLAAQLKLLLRGSHACRIHQHGIMFGTFVASTYSCVLVITIYLQTQVMLGR